MKIHVCTCIDIYIYTCVCVSNCVWNSVPQDTKGWGFFRVHLLGRSFPRQSLWRDEHKQDCSKLSKGLCKVLILLFPNPKRAPHGACMEDPGKAPNKEALNGRQNVS